MQNTIHSACRKKKQQNTNNEGEEELPGEMRWCVAGLANLLAVLRWRPVAVSWLTDGGSKQ
jgi:hypothetical protein